MNVKTSNSLKDKLLEIREELILNVTEDLLVIMEDKAISKKELAGRLGKTKAYITQLLSGDRNMTLGTFSDICYAIDVVPEINLPVNKTVVNENEYSYTKEADWQTYISDPNHPVRIVQKGTIPCQRTDSDRIWKECDRAA